PRPAPRVRGGSRLRGYSRRPAPARRAILTDLDSVSLQPIDSARSQRTDVLGMIFTSGGTRWRARRPLTGTSRVRVTSSATATSVAAVTSAGFPTQRTGVAGPWSASTSFRGKGRLRGGSGDERQASGGSRPDLHRKAWRHAVGNSGADGRGRWPGEGEDHD